MIPVSINWGRLLPILGGVAVLLVVWMQHGTIERRNATIDDLELDLKDEKLARENDRLTYIEAQRIAQGMEKLRLEQALAKQKEIYDATVTRYEGRIAGLDDLLGGLRRNVRQVAATARGQADDQPVSGLPDAASGTDAAAEIAFAPCDRECLVALIRYDELITWVQEQSGAEVAPRAD